MTTYIALLRGINVGGHRIIKMDALRTMLSSMGLQDARTYIQSGNVLFSASEAEEPLRLRIEHQIDATFGFAVPVMLRTAEAMRNVVEHCPFPADQLAEGESLYVIFLDTAPSQDLVDKLSQYSTGPDEYRIVGREVYILYRHSILKSKLTNSFFERMGVSSTARNWQTVNKLLKMAD